MVETIGNKYFKNATDAIVAVKAMSPTQKERMLMDIVWKSVNKHYSRTKKLTPRQLVVHSYNTSILAP